jgi:hypothetical protein
MLGNPVGIETTPIGLGCRVSGCLLPDFRLDLREITADSHPGPFAPRTRITTDCRERVFLMSENVAVEASSGDALKTVGDALETAVQAARDGAADAKATVEKALPAAGRFLSRFVYTTCYTLSYGVVFPTVLIAKSIPSNNVVVNGLVDGAEAAIDRADQWMNR